MGLLTSSVPRAEKVDTARKKSCLNETSATSWSIWERTSYLEDPQQNPKSNHVGPLLDEPHGNHGGAPEDRDASEMDARTESTDNQGRRRLEDDVGHEKDQDYDRLGKCLAPSARHMYTPGTYVSISHGQLQLLGHAVMTLSKWDRCDHSPDKCPTQL